jgi:hypothetical protein
MKLAHELSSLRVDTPKTKAKDDLCDAARYNIALMPWNWTILNSADRLPDTYQEPVPAKTEEDLRREGFVREKEAFEEVEAEFAEWNDHYG